MIKSFRYLLLFLAVIVFPCRSHSQVQQPQFLGYMNHPWVDSVLKTLTTDQKIAQCLWIAAYSNRDASHMIEVSDIIKKYGIGGIVFFQGTAAKQAELTNFYQGISAVPLIITLDAEWGVGMRLDNIAKFPFQMTLGAIADDSLIYRFGQAVAGQFRRLGMQMNLAPDADININPANPVINYRSFGEDRERVAAKAVMYMKGMQDNGVLATAKHFPGHGDTNVDSHLDLPVISHPRSRLDSIELYPFRRLINEGIGSVMTAHLSLPSLDTTTKLPSTLSPVIIQKLLQSDLGFNGLTVTDAMNMKGVTKYFRPGEAEARALMAGNDVVEFVLDVPAAIRETKGYVAAGKMTEADIATKCRKILAFKYWSGLHEFKPVSTENIDRDLAPASSKALIRDLYAGALTVLNNTGEPIPVKSLATTRIATLAINSSSVTSFQRTVEKYTVADHFYVDPSKQDSCEAVLKKLAEYDMVIAGVFGLDQRPNYNFGIKPELDDLIGKLNAQNRTIVAWFGNPYGIGKVKSVENTAGLILAYQENDLTGELAAQLVFGAIGASGTLPVSVNSKWRSGYGLTTPGNLRLQYGYPENAGMSSDILNNRIDSIVKAGLSLKAYPGCVVMAARKGIVVFSRSYGYQTYDNRIAVKENDLFDMASVTKISAPLAGLMLLDSQGRFSPDKTLGYYLPDFRKTNKGNIIMRDFLAHQGGLTAFIPFWRETLSKSGTPKKSVYHAESSRKYPLQVAQCMYINKNYRKKMFTEIKKSPLGEKKYLYSDLTFIITPEIINNLTNQKWNEFVTDNIYRKIGANNLVFNPLNKYPIDRIVPTEYDSLFRKQQLHGTVHDEGAAMLGGISGHAGLFATANDLMKLMELYKRMGEYGGEQLISRQVMKEYTNVQFPGNNNRRGLGFDKPLLNNSQLSPQEAYPAAGASPESFGHSGYTGTFVWIDPRYGITYVFLCNRVYPTRNNTLLTDMGIRSQILQTLYDSIEK